MTKIVKKLLGGFKFSKLLPPLGPTLEWISSVTRILMLLGPFVILGMGLYYFLNAPKEANYRSGYRCHWGMGSVEAWRFTQRLAGAVWTLLGLGLAIWMAIANGSMAELSQMDRMIKIAGMIGWQAVALLVSRLAIGLVVFARYDNKGQRRYTWKELLRPKE